MAGNNYFQFKKFRIIQEKSAMRVNTDGVLLGAWAAVSNEKNILDIGCGTGLIALMMAQRTSARITAIEIEENAANEANFNFNNSPWKNRLSVQNISFQEFNRNTKNKFDAIISNPPYFENSKKPIQLSRTFARHNSSLPLNELASGVDFLLSENGHFYCILPSDLKTDFLTVAEKNNLFAHRITEVKSEPNKPVIRYLFQFSKKKTALQKNGLSIYNETGKTYSIEYIKLTREFYLHL